MNRKKGVVTLGLLLLLSSLLIFSFLLNQQLSHFYREVAQQRKQYQQQKLQLWDLPVFNCAHIPLHGDSSAYEFQIDNPNGELKLSGYCQRIALLRKIPPTKLQEGKLNNFINLELLPTFKQRLTQEPNVYWFDKTQTTWQLKTDVYALVLAEGDLHIQGEGNISGAIITGGKLQIEEDVKLVYNRKLVTQVAENLRQWQLVEQGWHDFPKP